MKSVRSRDHFFGTPPPLKVYMANIFQQKKHYFFCIISSWVPNKQKPVKNTRLSGLFHSRYLWISRDNSRVVKVFVDDLMTGLGPSFSTAETWVYFTAKTWVYFTWCTRDLYVRKLFFSHLFVLHFLKTLGKGGGF